MAVYITIHPRCARTAAYEDGALVLVAKALILPNDWLIDLRATS